MNSTVKYIISMFLYGTIGIFLRFINASSEFVVLCRGLIGSITILAAFVLLKKKMNMDSIRKNLKYLVASGLCLGFNWIFLFLGYEYSPGVASLCNYLAPIFVVMLSPFIYKDKISFKQGICIAVALCGVILISGLTDGFNNINSLFGAVYGLLAAVGFVGIVICNKKISDIDPLEKTVIQLSASVLLVLPYVLFKHSIPVSLDIRSLLIIIMLGVVHTGIAYILYFDALGVISLESIAILGYLEPVTALLLPFIVLHENLTLMGLAGAVMIISAALFNELSSIRK